jgi:lipoate-protein ligase A
MAPLLYLACRPGTASILARTTKAVITSRAFSEAAAAHASSRTQVYLSRSTDPLVNLSFEHRLLQISHPDSTVLLLYANRPCVVFGRNQNPWLEVNLGKLAESGKDGGIQLVRRRSGGGTVFHDEGNVNFSVICPPAAFDRNKHAEMVVRALGRLGRPNTRVNERHDIVMDVAASSSGAAATFKISGSAYKLTRLRSLHHGTCLLRSPNLSTISPLLRSPAEPFIKARGVDSVRSPVANVDLDPDQFRDAVVAEFQRMYGSAIDVRHDDIGDETVLGDAEMRKGYDELSSRDWIYGQTPRFTLSTYPIKEDPRERPALPFDVSTNHQSLTS